MSAMAATASIRLIVLTLLLASMALASRGAFRGQQNTINQVDEDDSIDDYLSEPSEGMRYTLPELRCVSGSDCASSECSVMGMQRYSEPRCEPLGGLGAPCIPFGEPDNKTLSFPHAVLSCEDVYMMYCPCRRGLFCGEDATCGRAFRRG